MSESACRDNNVPLANAEGTEDLSVMLMLIDNLPDDAEASLALQGFLTPIDLCVVLTDDDDDKIASVVPNWNLCQRMKLAAIVKYLSFGFDITSSTTLDEIINVYTSPPSTAMELDEIKQRIARNVKASRRSKKRVERWNELDPILAMAELECTRKKLKGRAVYTFVTMKMISDIYDRISVEYQQPERDIPPETLTSLCTLLKVKTESYSFLLLSCERIFFIEPIPLHVVHLFHNDPKPAKMIYDEDLNGDYIRSNNGHVDFMLVRGNTRICVVEAKNDDMEQGKAQCIIAMELVSDQYNVPVVYGIVTNYVQWYFMQRSDDAIRRNFDTLGYWNGNERSNESLRRIAGKLYSLLSNND